MILDKDFYNQDTVTIARNFLGCYLIHNSPEGPTIGKIVETEAYLAHDPASHAFKGQTERTKAMFGEPGRVYIYFTYGMYYCFNVTTAPAGVGEAVLIRALEPLEGIELMQKRRSASKKTKSHDVALKTEALCSGPAKLVIAMGINKQMYGHDLTKEPLYILSKDDMRFEENKPFEITTTTRIGISSSKDLPLRFYITGNSFISKR